MKVFLINDSTSNPNWGDRAAATALRTMLEARGATIVASLSEDDLKATSFHLPQVVAPSRARRAIRRWSELLLPPVLPKIVRRIRDRFPRAPEFHPVPSTVDQLDARVAYFQANRERFQSLDSAIQSCDAVVIHGDGCMVGNGVMPRAQLFIAYLAKRLYSKPVAMTNHTADFDHESLLNMARVVYPLLDDVLFRDEISVQRCSAFCDGEYAPDAAFLFRPASKEELAGVAGRRTYYDVWPDAARFDPTAPYVCIGGSSIYSFGPDELPGIVDEFVYMVSAIQAAYSGQVVLTTSDLIDQRILRPVARKLGLPLVGLHTPIQQAVDIVGNADAYVGGRWHPSIFALRGGAPLVPLSSKTFKIDSLVEMAGLPPGVFDSLDLHASTPGIIKRLAKLVTEGDTERAKRKAWAQTQAEDCWDNVRILQAHGDGHAQ